MKSVWNTSTSHSPRLRAGLWGSIATCYPHDVPARQPPWGLAHAENCESVETMVETDAVIEPVATAVDDGGSCNGDSMAAAEACGHGRDRAQLRGQSASWGIGDAACKKSGKANAARNSGSSPAKHGHSTTQCSTGRTCCGWTDSGALWWQIGHKMHS